MMGVVTTSAAVVYDFPTDAGRLDPGSAAAYLAELFERHGATVLGLSRLLLRNREEAEDAVQQTFLSAYRSLLGGVRPRQPAAWLATIARNECRSRMVQHVHEPFGEQEHESPLPDPVAAAAARADLGELWRAIGELPRRQQEALMLREFSGLSYGELAEALAVSEPAVESLLFRARRDLRQRLKPAYGSVASIAPLLFIRDFFSRAQGALPDPGTTSALAKLTAAPLVAKLAVGAAAVVVAGGTVAAVEGTNLRGGSSKPVRPAPAAVVAPTPSSPLRVLSPVVAGSPVTAAVVKHSGAAPAHAGKPAHPAVSNSGSSQAHTAVTSAGVSAGEGTHGSGPNTAATEGTAATPGSSSTGPPAAGTKQAGPPAEVTRPGNGKSGAAPEPGSKAQGADKKTGAGSGQNGSDHGSSPAAGQGQAQGQGQEQGSANQGNGGSVDQGSSSSASDSPGSAPDQPPGQANGNGAGGNDNAHGNAAGPQPRTSSRG
jgi:RNA polymerase sigma factor (sigma-70 family)